MTKYVLDMDNKFICLCWNMYNRCNSNNMKCEGFLEDRPEWCPLIQIRDDE
jgi:hypothetical protein